MIGTSARYTVKAWMGTSIQNATPVTWSTDDASVATLTNDGRLTAQGPGTANISATYEGRRGTAAVRVAVNDDNPRGASLEISFEPDPLLGSLTPCAGSFWRGQTPSWNDIETVKETHGVGFTLKKLTYNFYNQDGVPTLSMAFPDNHYFPPYSEHVEDGCLALGWAPSGLFEEILEGVDDNGNQLTFGKRLRLLPVPGKVP